jgi:hypothetical protein
MTTPTLPLVLQRAFPHSSNASRAEILRRRVLQVDPEHHERRRVGLDASLHLQAESPRRIAHHPPRHGLVAIETADDGNVLLDGCDIQRHADMPREQCVQPFRVAADQPSSWTNAGGGSSVRRRP